jgi:hypothetical protein
VPRRLDHDLVGTNSIHLIVDAFAFSVQLSFYPQGGEFIGDDTKGPTRGVRTRSIVSECKNFWRCPIFIALAEGAESANRSSLLSREIRGPSTSLRGDDHPSSMDGVFSQFRHRLFFSEGASA